MAKAFDPYHKWLGISPDNWPPTHYQILGISPDEKDVEVINAAVIRQSAYVRNFQAGTYAKEAAQILNEISAAKACLLDAAKRAEYDAGLKPVNAPAEKAAARPARPAAARPERSPPPAAQTPSVRRPPAKAAAPARQTLAATDPLFAAAASSTALYPAPLLAPHAKRGVPVWLGILVGVGVALIGVAIVALLLSGGDTSPNLASNPPIVQVPNFNGPPGTPGANGSGNANPSPSSATGANNSNIGNSSTNSGNSRQTGPSGSSNGAGTTNSGAASPPSTSSSPQDEKDDEATDDSQNPFVPRKSRPGEPPAEPEPAEEEEQEENGQIFAAADDKDRGGWREIAFSGDGQYVATCTSRGTGMGDGSVRIWDVETCKEIAADFFRHLTPSLAIVFVGPDAFSVAAGNLRVDRHSAPGWKTDKVMDEFRIREFTVAALSRDAELVALGGSRSIFVAEVSQKDYRSGEVTNLDASVRALAISPSNKRITSAHADRTVHTWKASSGKEAYAFWQHTSQINRVAYSPDGQRVAAACQDGTLRVWESEKGAEIYLVKPPERAGLKCLVYSADGKTIVTGDDKGRLLLWNAEKGSVRKSLSASDSYVIEAVAISSDGRQAAAGDSSGTLRLWDLTRDDPSAATPKPSE